LTEKPTIDHPQTCNYIDISAKIEIKEFGIKIAPHLNKARIIANFAIRE